MKDFPTLQTIPWSTFTRAESQADFWQKWAQQKERLDRLDQKPTLSLIVTVDDSVAVKDFGRMLEAFLAQSYPYWEVIFLGSQQQQERVLKDRELPTERFSWIHGYGRWNDLMRLGLKKSKGQWVGTIAAGDVLSPVALFDFSYHIQKFSEVDVWFCNEARVSKDFRRLIHTLNRPPYRWFDLIHFNSIGTLFFSKRDAMGSALEKGAANQHDLLLRYSESKAQFKLIAASHLYHCRNHDHESATKVDEIVGPHLARVDFPAALTTDKDNFLRIVPSLRTPESHTLSVVMCFKNEAEITIQSLKALAKQTLRSPLQLLLVNNGSRPEELSLIKKALESLSLEAQIIDYPHPFNYAHMHNLAIREYATGSHIFLLNNDVFLETPEALDLMLRWSQFSWVGTVGIRLNFPNGKIQHAGFKATYGSGHRLALVLQDDSPFQKFDHVVYGSTFAACMFKKETFLSLGGLEEIVYPNALGDVDFNFACRKEGLTNIYLGGVKGIHLESKSRGAGYEYWEERAIEAKYLPELREMLREDFAYRKSLELRKSTKHFIRTAIGHWLAHPGGFGRPFATALRKIPKIAQLSAHS